MLQQNKLTLETRLSNLPAIPDIEREFIRGNNGVTLELLSNKVSPERGVITFGHGQWCSATTIKDQLLELADLGIAASAFSFSANGNSPKKPGLITLAKEQQDFLAVFDHYADKHSGVPIIAAGHSSGGYVLMKALANPDSQTQLSQVKAVVLLNSVPPSGSWDANAKFIDLLTLRELGATYSARRGTLPGSAAKKTLFNVSGLPEDYQSDRGKRLLNMQISLPLSNAECLRFSQSFSGNSLALFSNQDRLISWNPSDFTKLGIFSGDRRMISGDHMAAFGAEAKTVARLLAEFSGKYFK